jgi:zinc transport system substrate-binding protein
MWKLTAVLVTVALAGCGGAHDEGKASGPEIVAAFYPIAWAAEEIAGPTARVVNLTPPGAEPHDVELSPNDVQAVHGAHLVLYLGGGFQPALERALEGRDGPSVDLLEGQYVVDRDPHVWLDPSRFAEIVGATGRVLHREARAAELERRLHALDGELGDGLAKCKRREVVTSHTAFGYLARRYGLEQIALTGLSPEAEPSPGDLVALVDEVRESGATTVFFETLVSPELARTVARESDAKTAVLNPLEGLTQDEIDAGADYFSVMRANLATLRKALGCR